MASNDAKAAQYLEQAEKKKRATGGFLGGLFGGGNKLEDASDLYVKAANSFKMAKNWSGAGAAFCEAASVQDRMQNKHEAASCYVDGGNCFKKSDPQEAINCYTRAVDIFTDMGRFSMAAKQHQTIAEVYESDIVDIDKAMVNYEQAADYFRGEESNSAANKCMLKVAHFAGQLEQYQRAIDIFEQIAQTSMDNTLLKYSAKDYFFKAALCRLAVDTVEGQNAIPKYENLFPSFGDTRECKLLKDIIADIEDENVDGYTEHVAQYDSISRLDQWLTTMLLRIKKSISPDDDDDMK